MKTLEGNKVGSDTGAELGLADGTRAGCLLGGGVGAVDGVVVGLHDGDDDGNITGRGVGTVLISMVGSCAGISREGTPDGDRKGWVSTDSPVGKSVGLGE